MGKIESMPTRTFRPAPSAPKDPAALEAGRAQLAKDIDSADLDRLLQGIPADIGRLVGAAEVRLWFKDLLTEELYHRITDGNRTREHRISIDPSSAAGYAALTRSRSFAWKTGPSLNKRYVAAYPMVAVDDLLGVAELTYGQEGVAMDEPTLKVFYSLVDGLVARYRTLLKSGGRSTPYDRLLRSGVLESKALEAARAKAHKETRSVESVLIAEGLDKAQIGLSLAEHFECRFLDTLLDKPLQQDLIHKFSLDFLKTHAALPLSRTGDVVEVAVANPRNLTLLDDIARTFGTPNLILRVAIREDILAALEKVAEPPAAEKPPTPAPHVESPKKPDTDRILKSAAAPKEAAPAELGYSLAAADADVDDSEAVRLVNEMIQEALMQNASDIHLEPTLVGGLLCRFRVDGVCHDYKRVQDRCAKAVVSRVKIMAELDIAEHRLPQDGKIRMRDANGRKVDLRVAVVPTQGGIEDVVLRLLPEFKALQLENLAMAPDVHERFKKVIEQPHGIILCVGPTGSGKTTTLHGALCHIKGPEVKIWTAEDPVEITQDGLRQVQVQPKIGLTFERCLRAFLRCDPDIIMIGEIRDRETAEAAIEASLTGHLVLSTLHTNSAPETVSRLLDMGLDPYTFGDSLLGVLAQRLVRKVCQDCREEYHPSKDQFLELKSHYADDEGFAKLVPDPGRLKLARGKGCPRCFKSGYRGVMGIHELLVVTPPMRSLIHRKSDAAPLRELSIKGGMRLLKQDGLRKVVGGLTDLNEVLRNCIDAGV